MPSIREQAFVVAVDDDDDDDFLFLISDSWSEVFVVGKYLEKPKGLLMTAPAPSSAKRALNSLWSTQAIGSVSAGSTKIGA